jgi:hypothetical protein
VRIDLSTGKRRGQHSKTTETRRREAADERTGGGRGSDSAQHPEARIDLDRNQQQETKKLLADKQRYDAEKHQLEGKIARLKDQINGSTAPKMSEANADASLAVFRSLAPTKLHTPLKGHLRGVIAMGTPDTTVAFDYDQTHGEETIEQFWRVLEGLIVNLADTQQSKRTCQSIF